jgi:hypothetical protein
MTLGKPQDASLGEPEAQRYAVFMCKNHLSYLDLVTSCRAQQIAIRVKVTAVARPSPLKGLAASHQVNIRWRRVWRSGSREGRKPSHEDASQLLIIMRGRIILKVACHDPSASGPLFYTHASWYIVKGMHPILIHGMSDAVLVTYPRSLHNPHQYGPPHTKCIESRKLVAINEFL